jgi:enoyl-CoA hydratase/carnithine racemase
MQMPEASWGGFPGAGAPIRLPQVVGKARALELICTAKEICSTQMAQLGLIQAVYPQQSFIQEVAKVAQIIADNGPLATQGAKRIMTLRQEPGSRAARELSDALRYALEWSHDVDEGLAAHKHHRKPKFIGR